MNALKKKKNKQEGMSQIFYSNTFILYQKAEA